MTIADLRPAADRAKIVERVRQFDGAKADAGFWLPISGSGDHRAASFIRSKVTYEGTEAIFASICDATQITQVEARAEPLSRENENLRRRVSLSAAHLARLFDCLPGKMLALTPGDYKIVALTDEYAQTVKEDRDALLDKRLFDLFSDDPADPQADAAGKLRASLQRVQTLRVTDVMNLQRFPVRQPDGSVQQRYSMLRNKPILDGDGHLIYIIHRVEDVTEVLAGQGLPPKVVSGTSLNQPFQLAEARATMNVMRFAVDARHG